MAAGNHNGAKVEIEFVAGSGTWVDVSAYVDWSAGIVERKGRSRHGDASTPATLTFVLHNVPDPVTGVSPFSPGNPLGPYFPNVKEGRKVRTTVTRAGVDYRQFTGWIKRWRPSGGLPSQLRTTVDAVDVLGQFARRELRSDYLEAVVRFAPASTLGPLPLRQVDIWPFDEQPGAKYLRNLGVAERNGFMYRGRVYQSNRPQGTMTLTGGPPAGGPLIDGAAEWRRGSINSAGPVALLRLSTQNEVARVGFWVRIDEPANGADDVVIGWSGLNLDNITFRFQVNNVSGVTEFELYCVAVDGSTSTIRTTSGGVDDGQWHFVMLKCYDGGSLNPAVAFEIDGVNQGNAFCDLQTVAYLSVGAYMPPKSPGSNTNSFQGFIGGVFSWSQGDAGLGDYGPNVYQYGNQFNVKTVMDRLSDLYYQGASIADLLGGHYASGTSLKLVLPSITTGKTLLDVWEELNRTTGGILVSAPDGRPWYITDTVQRSRTVVATVTLGEDDDRSTEPVFVRDVAGRPTRVKATSPFGDVEVSDAAAIAIGERRDETVSTAAGTIDGARDVAADRVRFGSLGLRLESFAVDLATAKADLWAAFFSTAMTMGGRIRVAGMPVGVYGFTYMDVYVLGWTKTITDTTVVFVLDTEPADAPPEAFADDATYGRAAFGDGVATLAAAITASATSMQIAFSPSSNALTVDATQYPLDLDVNGERVTVSSAPAGSTSPQTLTIVRGVAPSGARAHAAGEAVEVWFAARAAL